ENDLIFKAQFQKIDNLYRYSSNDKKLYIISDSPFGAFHPSSGNNHSVLYNEYQFNGYKAAFLDSTQLIGKEITAKFEVPAQTDHRIKASFAGPKPEETQTHQVEKYNSLSHLFNFHSLSISSNNFESFDNYRPGIFWIANDLLNTSQLKLGYEYDLDMEKSIYSAELTYQKYYPKFNFSYRNRGQI